MLSSKKIYRKQLLLHEKILYLKPGKNYWTGYYEAEFVNEEIIDNCDINAFFTICSINWQKSKSPLDRHQIYLKYFNKKNRYNNEKKVSLLTIFDGK